MSATHEEATSAHKKGRTFRWSPTMLEDLKCLYGSKVSMDYKGKDFDWDRLQQHAALRVEMARKYGEESFGPAETNFLDDEEMTTQKRKEQKDKVKVSESLIKIGYNWLLSGIIFAM